MLKRIFAAAVMAVAGLAVLAPAPARADQVPIEAFIDYPQFSAAALSPNGRYIAGVRREGTSFILVVLDWQTKQVTPIQRTTDASSMQFSGVTWKNDDILVFTVMQMVNVREVTTTRAARNSDQPDRVPVFQVYASSRSGELISLYGSQAATAGDVPVLLRNVQVVDRLVDDPDHVLLLAPGNTGSNLVRANVRNGRNETIESFPFSSNTFAIRTDRTGTPVMRQTVAAGGRGASWYRRANNRWEHIITYRGVNLANSGPDFDPAGATNEPGVMFVSARRDGADVAELYRYDTRTGQFGEKVFSINGFDMSSDGGVVTHPVTQEILGICYWTEVYQCEGRNEDFTRGYRAVTRALGPNLVVQIAGMSDDTNRWLINASGPQDMGSVYLYDRTTRALDFIGGERPSVEPEQLATQEVVRYTTRDGYQTWGYLWTPPGAPQGTPLPAVVVPHGGPEGRDFYGFDPFAMYLANRGFAVLQPNFRGGGGQGRRFVEAGWNQWGQRMQNDFEDGVRAMITAGRFDANRICVMGWSYGGYKTMAASLLNQDLFKCAVAGAGVSDLEAMMRWTREEEGGAQGVSYQYWSNSIGRPSDQMSLLRRYSPAQRASEIRMPLLLIHGQIDDIVPIEQSEIMRDALKREGREPRLITLPLENHQWAPMTIANRRTTLDEAERFIRQHIGPGVGPSASPMQ